MCRPNNVEAPTAGTRHSNNSGLNGFDDLSDLNWLSEEFGAPQAGYDADVEIPEELLGDDPNGSNQPSMETEDMDILELCKDNDSTPPWSYAAAAQPSDHSANPDSIFGPGDVFPSANVVWDMPNACLQIPLASTSRPSAAPPLSAPVETRECVQRLLAQLQTPPMTAAALNTQMLQRQPHIVQSNADTQNACDGQMGRAAAAVATQQADAVERMKQKRRESAQRSRQRKNCYMRQLEHDNRLLKQEVIKLTQALSQLQQSIIKGRQRAAALPATQAGNAPTQAAAATAAGAGAALLGSRHAGLEHMVHQAL